MFHLFFTAKYAKDREGKQKRAIQLFMCFG